MDYLVHVAYVLYLLSYSVRDIMWLRILTIVASVPLVPYYYFQPKTLWAPMIWLGVFMVVNLLQLLLVLRERRPAAMSAEQSQLHTGLFAELSPRDFLRLFALAMPLPLVPGQRLLTSGDPGPGLTLIREGRAISVRSGVRTAEFGPDDFVGEVEFALNRRAESDVVVTDAGGCLFWSSADLERFFRDRPHVRASLHVNVARALVARTERNSGLLPLRPEVTSVSVPMSPGQLEPHNPPVGRLSPRRRRR